MEIIRNKLFELSISEHPKADRTKLSQKIEYVLSAEKITIENFISKNNLSEIEKSPQWKILFEFLLDEISLKFKETEDYFTLIGPPVDNNGEEDMDIGSSNDVLSDALRNPLTIEYRDPVLALKLIEKYYPLPYFEKEAYKLRLIKKIIDKEIGLVDELQIQAPPIKIENFLSEAGILSLQRRAAIRIKLLWKKSIQKALKRPVSDYIDEQLN